MQRVVVTVKRKDEARVRDLEVPADIDAVRLAEMIARALRWESDRAGQPMTYKIEAHPLGRMLQPGESLATAGVWDGSWLVLHPDIPEPEPAPTAKPAPVEEKAQSAAGAASSGPAAPTEQTRAATHKPVGGKQQATEADNPPPAKAPSRIASRILSRGQPKSQPAAKSTQTAPEATPAASIAAPAEPDVAPAPVASPEPIEAAAPIESAAPAPDATAPIHVWTPSDADATPQSEQPIAVAVVKDTQLEVAPEADEEVAISFVPVQEDAPAPRTAPRPTPEPIIAEQAPEVAAPTAQADVAPIDASHEITTLQPLPVEPAEVSAAINATEIETPPFEAQSEQIKSPAIEASHEEASHEEASHEETSHSAADDDSWLKMFLGTPSTDEVTAKTVQKEPAQAYVPLDWDALHHDETHTSAEATVVEETASAATAQEETPQAEAGFPQVEPAVEAAPLTEITQPVASIPPANANTPVVTQPDWLSEDIEEEAEEAEQPVGSAPPADDIDEPTTESESSVAEDPWLQMFLGTPTPTESETSAVGTPPVPAWPSLAGSDLPQPVAETTETAQGLAPGTAAPGGTAPASQPKTEPQPAAPTSPTPPAKPRLGAPGAGPVSGWRKVVDLPIDPETGQPAKQSDEDKPPSRFVWKQLDDE